MIMFVLKQLQSCSTCLDNTSFNKEAEQNNNSSVLYDKIIQEQGKGLTTVYRRPTLGGVYNHFDT